MHDVWWEKNPNERQFTWRDKAFKVQCRLDYFLVSQNLVNLAKECRIIHAPGSDHCAVKLFIQSDSLNKKVRPGFWKFNSSLLEDESYITELKENIKIYRNKYQCVEARGLRWDLMKMEVRGFTIAYAKRKAKDKRDEEKNEIKRTSVSVRKVQKQSTTTYTYTNYSDALKTNNRTKSKGCNHTKQSEMG